MNCSPSSLRKAASKRQQSGRHTAARHKATSVPITAHTDNVYQRAYRDHWSLVLSRPMEGGSCGAQAIDLPGDSQGADLDEYSALDDDGGAQEAESCADPKAQADKGERKDAGEDKKEAEETSGGGGEKFQESELEGESGVDKRESRYQLNDYPSCESKAVYDDADVAKYRDAFGGFPQEAGRGKRVKRSFFYH